MRVLNETRLLAAAAAGAGVRIVSGFAAVGQEEAGEAAECVAVVLNALDVDSACVTDSACLPLRAARSCRTQYD